MTDKEFREDVLSGLSSVIHLLAVIADLQLAQMGIQPRYTEKLHEVDVLDKLDFQES